MLRVYRILVGTCWALGLVSLVVALVLKLVPAWAQMLNTTPRGGLILASTLFLCVLATQSVKRQETATA